MSSDKSGGQKSEDAIAAVHAPREVAGPYNRQRAEEDTKKLRYLKKTRLWQHPLEPRQHYNPQEIIIALDSFSRVIDEPLTANEMIDVLERDKAVIGNVIHNQTVNDIGAYEQYASGHKQKSATPICRRV
jgi:hypothetical protein